MTQFAATIPSPPRAQRIAVSGLFFLQGLCFATWASRIPSLQHQLGLSNTGLGLVLLALPAGSFLGLLVAGWLVTRFGSRAISAIGLILYAALLLLIGHCETVAALLTVLLLFGFAGNSTNIAMNTQAVAVEARYGRKILASFHGLWSLAGFAAAGVGTWAIGASVAPSLHFTGVALVIVAGLAFVYPYIYNEPPSRSAQTPIFLFPSKALLALGLICFCSMICEGALFDWSNVYFEKVVKARGAWAGAGYTAFMATMATGRFVADRISHRFGTYRTIQGSAVLVTAGLLLAVLFPTLPGALTGFLLIGFGVSSVVPLVYSEAGRSSENAGMALAAVSSIGFLGFLVGPPVIGLLAGVFSLRVSFLFVALMALLVFVSSRIASSKAAQHDPK
ncbi:MAG: MFS transporter [Chitinophagaceae bacterium]|nr:MAG: MFS transporter [Chitinophagaceae bacterium]